MTTKKDIDIAIRFLKANYPVIRLKCKDRFKRAIIGDGGKVFYLNKKEIYVDVKKHLNYALWVVFDLEYKVCDEILNDYLNL